MFIGEDCDDNQTIIRIICSLISVSVDLRGWGEAGEVGRVAPVDNGRRGHLKSLWNKIKKHLSFEKFEKQNSSKLFFLSFFQNVKKIITITKYYYHIFFFLKKWKNKLEKNYHRGRVGYGGRRTNWQLQWYGG